MKTFELLDIATADMAFAAYGKTLEEMYVNAAKALMSVMFEGKVGKKIRKIIEVEAEEETVLLHDWLQEVLYALDTEHIIFSDFKVKLGKGKISAECFGEKYNPEKHKFIIDVKAITYHMMEVKKEKDFWKCRVVVDV
jgi:SHS2 domain-containing protein